MTIIRRNSNLPVWPNFLNDIFNNEWDDWSHRNFSLTNTTLPSVNIKESDADFVVEMAAPGMEKNDFKIEVNMGILSISSEKSSSNNQEEKGKYTRQEFSYQSFCRSFSLPDSADSDKINAKYDNGILQIYIPKKEEAKPKPVRLIDIK